MEGIHIERTIWTDLIVVFVISVWTDLIVVEFFSNDLKRVSHWHQIIDYAFLLRLQHITKIQTKLLQ